MYRYKIICVFLLLGSLVTSGCGNGHPSDKIIREIFHEKHAVFEKLAHMLSEDTNVQEITSANITYATLQGPTLPNERLKAYRECIAAIGYPETKCIRRSDGTVLILISFKGLAIGGSAKGVVFVPGKLQLQKFQLVPALDSDWRERGEGEFVVPIEGEWYIFGNAS